MTVIAFSVARFTPADIAAFNSVAQPRLERGQWSGVQRQTGPDYDRLIITFPGTGRTVFSFERDRNGLYRLWFHDRGGPHCIGRGETATECLAVWRPRGEQTQAGIATA